MAHNLLTAEEFTLAEAACMLQFPDPMAGLRNAGYGRCDLTNEAIADMITAIESRELPCVEPFEDVLRRSEEQKPCVYMATCRRRGLYDPALHEQRSRYVVKRAELIAFAKLREYPAPELLKDDPAVLASRLRKLGHAERMAPYAGPVAEAVTRWEGGDHIDHKMMRDEIIQKKEYGDLNGTTLLRLLNKAANENGWEHLIFNTAQWRAARPKSPA